MWKITMIFFFQKKNVYSQENDILRLLNKVDDNWYEGMLDGRSGYIPQSYVNVKIALP